jgi:hypothetical protein
VARRSADAHPKTRRDDALPAAPLGATAYAVLFAGYVGALMLVYQPALQGPFLSDDIHYVATNPYVHELSLENVWAILQPYGAATIAVVNYAPVQMLLHGITWQLFGPEVLGHHVLNLLFHAGASLLLVPFFLAAGVPRIGALLSSVFFLLHPANVEAVAWISQLKTNASMVLCLGALLAHPKRPALGFGLFALALLAKPTAAVALPVAFWLEWARTGRVRGGWLLAWLAAFAAFAAVEFTAHQRSGAAPSTLYETPGALVRTIAALAMRYLVLGATGVGASAFHDPDPAWSLLDPWWLASLPALGLLGSRLWITLRRRSQEAGFWLFALVSFGPVSQIFPFIHPFADRYLYYILPGLLGGALLAGRELVWRSRPELRTGLERLAVAVGVALCLVFALRSHERAGIWRAPAFVLADAAAHYPDGLSGRLLRSKRAAQAGDAEQAATEIRGAMDRGYNRFEQLLQEPAYEPVRHTQVFQGVIRDMAKLWIEASREWKDPTQVELHRIANAHFARGEGEQAILLLRRALARGGPIDEIIRAELVALGARP